MLVQNTTTLIAAIIAVIRTLAGTIIGPGISNYEARIDKSIQKWQAWADRANEQIDQSRMIAEKTQGVIV